MTPIFYRNQIAILKMTKISFLSKIIIFIFFPFLLLCSCKEDGVNSEVGSYGDQESELYEVSYKLSDSKQDLVRKFIERYSSSVDELLSSAGIGYVSDEKSEVFQAHLEDDAIVVRGNQSAHLKIEKFLGEYFNAEYLERVFTETDDSNREWGVIPLSKTE